MRLTFVSLFNKLSNSGLFENHG